MKNLFIFMFLIILLLSCEIPVDESETKTVTETVYVSENWESTGEYLLNGEIMYDYTTYDFSSYYNGDMAVKLKMTNPSSNTAGLWFYIRVDSVVVDSVKLLEGETITKNYQVGVGQIIEIDSNKTIADSPFLAKIYFEGYYIL